MRGMDTVMYVAGIKSRRLCTSCGGRFSRSRIVAAEKWPPVDVTANAVADIRRDGLIGLGKEHLHLNNQRSPQPPSSRIRPQMPSSGRRLRRFASSTVTQTRAAGRIASTVGGESAVDRPAAPAPLNQSNPCAKLTVVAVAVTSAFATRGGMLPSTSEELAATVRPTSCGSQEGNTICSYFIT